MAKKNIPIGNLYDMNRNILKQQGEAKTGKALFSLEDKVLKPYLKKYENEKYFMLLSNEMCDYTVFHSETSQPLKFQCWLNTCLHNRGLIYEMLPTEDGVALEIWVKHDKDNEIHLYYLLPYTNAVIEV